MTPATVNLANTIVAAAQSGKSIHIVTTSAGAIVTRNALILAKNQLDIANGVRELPNARNTKASEVMCINDANGAARRITERSLSNIKVETYGTATLNFPVDGPKYLHWVNTNDVIPMKAAPLQSIVNGRFIENLGKNSVTVAFDKSGADLNAIHSLESYLPYRQSMGGLM